MSALTYQNIDNMRSTLSCGCVKRSRPLQKGLTELSHCLDHLFVFFPD